MPVAPIPVILRGRPARVFAGGAGPPLLLVHGGWGGARLHWSTVWEPLATRHRVVAPDLPGLGAVDDPPLASVADYAAWLVELLDALGIDAAWCAGNSFGGSLVWSLAGRAPARCRGVVIVDGVPMPRTPAPLGWLGRRPAGRALMRALVRRWSYEPGALRRAFADVAHAPPELARAIVEDWPRIVPRFADLLVAGDGPPAPRAPVSLVWGAADRLPGTSLAVARRLALRLDAPLRVIPGAGHFPQLEDPAAFVAALEGLISAGAARRR